MLVVLDDESGAALERVTRTHRVIHVASQRVVVVDRSAGATDEDLESVPGVAAVAGAELPREVIKGLGPDERRFVSAWFQRTREGSSKERAGEGLSWDAPGFTPPDPPASRSD